MNPYGRLSSPAESDLISSSGLGAIDRLVREIDSLVQSAKRRLHGGDTYADGARDRFIVIFDGGLLDGAAKPLGHKRGPCAAGFRQDGNELLAAPASELVDFA